MHPVRGDSFDALLVLAPATDTPGAWRAVIVDLRGTTHARPAGPLSSLRVLVVDDEPLIRQAVSRMLVSLGATVATAATGDEAVAAARAATPDVLLEDVHLRGENGVDVARRVRDVHPDVAVVYVSGEPKAAHVAAGLLDRGDWMIAKPFAVSALVDVLTAATRRPRGKHAVLVVDRYEPGRTALYDLLGELGYEAIGVDNDVAAAAIAETRPIGLVIADHAPPWARADDAVAAVRTVQPDVPALVLSEIGAPAFAIESAQVLRKRATVEELLAAISDLVH